jgi:type I restriction enzyme, S subunit
VGDVYFVTQVRPLLMLCDLIYRLRLLNDRLDGQYLSHFFTSPMGREQIESDARGTSNSMVKISQEHIKNWWLPLPPIDEQRAIVAHIALATAKLDALRATTERTIALLKERRAALIAAAVTGKLDVQGAERHLDVVAD